MHSPYRHSVWIDVFGIVLFGSVLVGGAGYLLYQAGGAASSGGGGGGSGNGTAAVAQSSTGGGARSPHRSRQLVPPQPGGELRSSGGAASTPTGTKTPFPESWQEQAVPELTGPAASPGGSPEGAAVGEGTPEPSGPTIASRGPLAGDKSTDARTRGGSAGSGWQEDAQRLASQSRALSSQLRGMDQVSGEDGSAGDRREASSSEQSDQKGTASGGSASASSDPGTPTPPDQVPIGGLGWLAAAGFGFGAYRLRSSSASGVET